MTPDEVLNEAHRLRKLSERLMGLARRMEREGRAHTPCHAEVFGAAIEDGWEAADLIRRTDWTRGEDTASLYASFEAEAKRRGYTGTED